MLIRHGKPLLNDEFAYRDIRIEGDRITETGSSKSTMMASPSGFTITVSEHIRKANASDK